jgi:hypothetical protein
MDKLPGRYKAIFEEQDRKIETLVNGARLRGAPLLPNPINIKERNSSLR